MRRFALCIARLAACATFSLCASRPDASLRADEAERFLRDAPAQWSAYAKQLARLQGRMEENVVIDGRVVDTIIDVKHNAKCRMFVILRSPPDPALRDESVAAHNDRYAFTLRRSAPDQAWRAGGIQAGAAWPAFELLSRPALDRPDFTTSALNILTGHAERCACLMEAPLAPATGETLERLTRHRGFRVLSAKLAAPGRLDVRFECPHPEEEKPFLSIQGGTLVVDPDHYHCLRSADVDFLHTTVHGRTHVTLEYSLSDDGFPMPSLLNADTRGQYVTKDQVTDFVSSQRVRYELHEATRLPSDEEFTLTAFGLPEPNLTALASGKGVMTASASAEPDASTGGIPEINLGLVAVPKRESGGTNWLLWGLLLGIPCIVTACALVFLSRRRAGGPAK